MQWQTTERTICLENQTQPIKAGDDCYVLKGICNYLFMYSFYSFSFAYMTTLTSLIKLAVFLRLISSKTVSVFGGLEKPTLQFYSSHKACSPEASVLPCYV